MNKIVRHLKPVRFRARVHPITVARQRIGMAMAELARKSKVPLNTLWRIENWYHAPRPTTMKKIEKALGR